MGNSMRTGTAALVLGLGAQSLALADASTGAAWLEAQAQADGSYSTHTSISTAFQATAETLSAFTTLGESHRSTVPAARQYLLLDSHLGAEYLARKIISNRDAGAPVQEPIAELLTRQAADGGFGEFAGYHSEPLATAFALDALVPDQIYATPLSRAIGYLLNTQGADGSWGRASEHGGIDVTAAVIKALNRYRVQFTAIPQAIANGANYLLSQRDAAGLWDQDFLTASAVLSLSQSLTDLAPVRSSADALRARQLGDGSWGQDVRSGPGKSDGRISGVLL